MRILYINNDGSGFADYVDVTPNMTVDTFFNEKMPNRKPDDFLISSLCLSNQISTSVLTGASP